MERKPLIGLVGGIGSGKSTVAALLAQAGGAVIDSDALNRAQLGMEEVARTLKSWWGRDVCDATGAVDRTRIAKIIFNDAAQRNRLERYIHPRIAAHRDHLIEAYQRNRDVRFIVLDTPLLVESHLHERCDAVVFVDAADEVRRKRVTQLRGWAEEDWVRREKSQNALDKKRAIADYVIVNNSSDLAELRSAVHDLLSRLGPV